MDYDNDFDVSYDMEFAVSINADAHNDNKNG